MDDNPYKPPTTPMSGEGVRPSSNEDKDALAEPVAAYTANGNLEAHSVVTWLESNGVRSYAVEDNSGVSLFVFGTISQFHKPQVFVNKAELQRARELLRQFESQRDKPRVDLVGAPPITAECEACGASNEFPASQDGTTQNCSMCDAFMDVGSFDWPDDFDVGEEEPASQTPDTAEDAVYAAVQLDKTGEWDAAIAAYRVIADRWPEHATYVANCIADVQRKLDATQ
jgi:hypothetical protein